MIIRKGDLFTTTDSVIAHGCNNRGVMGAGVAKIIRERYPQAYHDYLRALHANTMMPVVQGRNGLGWNNYSMGLVSRDGGVIVNMITQTLDKVDRPVSYDAIDTCFADMFRWMQSRGRCMVSIPKIGAGLGGGDWNVIEAIIRAQESKFAASGICVTVWEL